MRFVTAMPPLSPSALEDILGITRAEQKKRGTPQEVSCRKLLNYATHLRRACSYSSHLIGDNDLSVVRVPRKSYMSAIKLREV